MVPDNTQDMAPESTGAGEKQEVKKLKGLPVVKVMRDEPCLEYVLDMFGWFEIKYVTMLWLIFSLSLGFYAFSFYFAMQHENFGYNWHFILIVTCGGFALDSTNKIIADFWYGRKMRVIQPNGTTVIVQILYTLLMPFVYQDPLLHLVAAYARDVSMALQTDLLRVYFWPDNLQNRKRIANFQTILDDQGFWFWPAAFKTPICRLIFEHHAMKWWSIPDGPIDYTRLCFFPLQIFAYEVCTDFLYYWMHRALHESPYLYKSIHKMHHASKCPTAINASSMTYMETLCTFCITDGITPFIFHYLGWPMTVSEHALYISWLLLVETQGHGGLVLSEHESTGYRMGLAGLMTFFDILLEPVDHELHHWNNTKNYGKRLPVWDKVFGTYDYENKQLCADACLGKSLSNTEGTKTKKA